VSVPVEPVDPSAPVVASVPLLPSAVVVALVVAVGSSVVDALVSAVGSVVGLPELESVVGSDEAEVSAVPEVSSPPHAAVVRRNATMQGEVNRVMDRPYGAPRRSSPGASLATTTTITRQRRRTSCGWRRSPRR
jgi:hypothetical protein